MPNVEEFIPEDLDDVEKVTLLGDEKINVTLNEAGQK
jgi:hypothetical protein